MPSWLLATHVDRVGAQLADGHYSRRTPGSPQFMPPGERIVLVTRDRLAVFGWWRPHPASGQISRNGLDGWTCSIFRRTGGALASDLIVEAEQAIRILRRPPGPDGLLTYVWPAKIRSVNPGCCFKKAGYVHRGRWSADGRKMLFEKPWTP